MLHLQWFHKPSPVTKDICVKDILQNGARLLRAVDVTCVQRTFMFGCCTEFFMELELQDEADKIPTEEKIIISLVHHIQYSLVLHL